MPATCHRRRRLPADDGDLAFKLVVALDEARGLASADDLAKVAVRGYEGFSGHADAIFRDLDEAYNVARLSYNEFGLVRARRGPLGAAFYRAAIRNLELASICPGKWSWSLSAAARQRPRSLTETSSRPWGRTSCTAGSMASTSSSRRHSLGRSNVF